MKPGEPRKWGNGPGQVVIHHNGGVLKVLALAEHVRGDDDAEFLGCARQWNNLCKAAWQKRE